MTREEERGAPGARCQVDQYPIVIAIANSERARGEERARRALFPRPSTWALALASLARTKNLVGFQIAASNRAAETAVDGAKFPSGVWALGRGMGHGCG